MSTRASPARAARCVHRRLARGSRHVHRRLARACGAALAIACAGVARRAAGQACCAGSAAVTPARLTLHEDALVGLTVRDATVFGSYDPNGHYAPTAAGTSEFDYEEDLFGAVRVFDRGQLALLVPLLETVRHVPGTTEVGGGIGDVNFSGRYDFTLAGQSRYLPGIAALLGVTAPTGRAPESAHNPLQTDATGIGAFQGNLGLAIEQIYGPWLFNLTGLVAKRAARSFQGIDETLATQFTGLLATAYTWDDGGAVGAVVSYSTEGDATVNGATSPASAKGVLMLSVAGLWLVNDRWRVQGSLFLDPPLSTFGNNLPATGGLTLTVIRSWS